MPADSIDTPALLVDLDALEFNIETLARHFKEAGARRLAVVLARAAVNFLAACCKIPGTAAYPFCYVDGDAVNLAQLADPGRHVHRAFSCLALREAVLVYVHDVTA